MQSHIAAATKTANIEPIVTKVYRAYINSPLLVSSYKIT